MYRIDKFTETQFSSFRYLGMKALDVTSTKYGLGDENALKLYSDDRFIAL